MLGDFIHKRFDTDSKSKADAKTSPKGKKISNKESEGQPLSSAEKDDKKQSKYYPEDKPCAHDKHFTEQIKDKLQEFIGHHHHVPFFLKDNQYIHTGYRIHFTTPKKVLKSLFILHNESVNIWSHLGGAIILIIICFALCFSVSKLETHNLKKFVQVEVSELFEPIYERLPNIPELEAELSEKLSQTKGDITKLGESTIINLETKLESISSEIERVKKKY
jgi:adiponectin receptor